jgi:hypothetical protein
MMVRLVQSFNWRPRLIPHHPFTTKKLDFAEKRFLKEIDLRDIVIFLILCR